MREVSTKNFGLLIAFLLPGFTAISATSFFSETVQSWLGGPQSETPTVGGFLYLTLASIVAGLTVSTVRWALIDTLHHHTGIPEPGWDFSKLQPNVTAFETLIEIHYRYYQWYSNMLIALVFLLIARACAEGIAALLDWFSAGTFVLCVVFFAGSRDTLRKYYDRGAKLLHPHPAR